ncbi:MAG TPA: hypothetical protein VND87_02195 [Stellaceae bacterium]|nr:hypothetical protein [Stellaceae bacterium]
MAAIDSEFVPPASPAIASPLVGDAIPARLRRVGVRPRQVLAMCVVGTLTLSLFASRDLPSWANRFADRPGAPTLQAIVERWDDTMGRLGLTRPHETLRAAVAWLLQQGWNGPLQD